jgi:hypothetical protein
VLARLQADVAISLGISQETENIKDYGGEADICEPVSDAHSLFGGKIHGNLRIQALKTTVGAAFPHVNQ